MTQASTNDLDYLTTRLHARRSRMAEAERLDALCRIRAVPDLGRAIRPEFEFSTAASLQRRLLDDLVQEYSFCLQHLDGAGRKFVHRLQSRFQIENIKVLLRGLLKHASFEVVREQLIPLPRELSLDAQALLEAETLDAFAQGLPGGLPRKHLQSAIAAHHDPAGAFFWEAALDGGYFREVLDLVERLVAAEKELIEPLVRQEIEKFHLQLAVRGIFNHGYAVGSLAPLGVPGSGAAGERFEVMLAANDISAVAKVGLGCVFDELPAAFGTAETASSTDPAVLESLATRRLLRLANVVFRRSQLGLGAVVGYLEIRRIEVANLITLSEGIRLGVGPELLRARLTQRRNQEVPNV